jgi:hypothetical protein
MENHSSSYGTGPSANPSAAAAHSSNGQRRSRSRAALGAATAAERIEAVWELTRLCLLFP